MTRRTSPSSERPAWLRLVAGLALAWSALAPATAQTPGGVASLSQQVDGLPPTEGLRWVRPGLSQLALQVSSPGGSLLGRPFLLAGELRPGGSGSYWGLPGEPASIALSAAAVPLLDGFGASGWAQGLAPDHIVETDWELSLLAPQAPAGTELVFQACVHDPSAPNGLTITPESVSLIEGVPTLTPRLPPQVNVGGAYGIEMLESDLDLDGMPELLVGAQGADVPGVSRAGVVYLYEDTQTTPSHVFVAPDPQTAAEFGVIMTTGDFNQDGFPDVAIGARDYTYQGIDRCGQAYVYFGPTWQTVVTLRHPQPVPKSEFGGWIDAGDLNADGYDDLVVGVIGQTVNGLEREGSFVVYYGPYFINPMEIVNPVLNNSNARFAYRLVVEDFDQDGFDDVAAAHTFHDVLTGQADASGAVSLFLGPYLQTRFFVPNPFPSLLSRGLMGSDMDVADFDEDGFPDLAVGIELDASGGVVGGGSVLILRGPYFQTALPQIYSPLPGVDYGFGSAVAAGDFNGDGVQDLFVGEWYHDIGSVQNAGRAFALLGPDFLQYEVVTQPQIGAWWRFGRRIQRCDLDQDGRDEMIVGAPFSAVAGGSTAGAIYFLSAP